LCGLKNIFDEQRGDERDKSGTFHDCHGVTVPVRSAFLGSGLSEVHTGKFFGRVINRNSSHKSSFAKSQRTGCKIQSRGFFNYLRLEAPRANHARIFILTGIADTRIILRVASIVRMRAPKLFAESFL
jgi:hypothetical protein